MTNRRPRIRSAVLALAVLVPVTLAALATVVIAKPKSGDVLTVQVIRAKVMKKPKFIGGVAGNVSRGAQLEFIKAKGQWYQVSGAADGWIHKGQVVEGKVELSTKPGQAGSNASRDEVELAGRGFTPQVEENYKNKNPELDFSHIDAIEKAEARPEDIEEFVADGRLTAGAK